jgi:adenosylhomocysteine nucleosidase
LCKGCASDWCPCVSGDQFISDKEVKNKIADNFDGYCTEMEGAAIAQAAYLNNIPFVILRAISDKADDSATMDYPAFEKQAIKNSVLLIKELVDRI